MRFDEEIAWAEEVRQAESDLRASFLDAMANRPLDPLGSDSYGPYRRSTAYDAAADVLCGWSYARGAQWYATLFGVLAASTDTRAQHLLSAIADDYASQGCDKLAEERVKAARAPWPKGADRD